MFQECRHVESSGVRCGRHVRGPGEGRRDRPGQGDAHGAAESGAVRGPAADYRGTGGGDPHAQAVAEAVQSGSGNSNIRALNLSADGD